MPRDTSIPSFLIPQDGPSVHLSIPLTNATVANQGYTYNQPGFTYNQVGVQYGGVYNTNQDVVPLFSETLSDILPRFTLSSTNAQLANQGYTYNQPGITYNQLGVMYGGIYNTNEDIVPLFIRLLDTLPSPLTFSDIYHPYVPPPPAVPLGPGFFMFITQ